MLQSRSAARRGGERGLDRAEGWAGGYGGGDAVVVYPIDEGEWRERGREECGRVRWKRVSRLLVPGSTILSPNPSSPFDN